MQIVQAAPPHLVQRIIRAAMPEPPPKPLPSGHHEWEQWQVAPRASLLLSLLPRTFHPDVVRACYPSVEQQSALCVRYMTHACTQAAGAPFLLQLLAGVAPMAAGCADDAWDPEWVSRIEASATRSALPWHQPPKSTRGSQHPAIVDGVAPAGGLTRLEVALPEYEDLEVPRWCGALAQLRTLREFTLRVPFLRRVRVRDLTLALRQLPALHTLHLSVACPHVGGIGMHDMLHLLKGVGELPHLSALVLDRFDCGDGESDRDWGAKAGVTAALERLSGLTSLSITFQRLNEAWAQVFAVAMWRLQELRELRVSMCGDAGPPDAEGTLTRLLCAQLPPPLLSLSLRGLRLREYTVAGVRHNPTARLCRGIGGPVAAQLTSLQLTDGDLGGGSFPMHAHAIAAMLADMPALRSLDLSSNCLQDVGLCAVAGALRGLRSLTRLLVGHNCATHVGVFAVVNTVLERPPARGVGEGWLAHLDVSGAEIGAARAQGLAVLVLQLRGLVVGGFRSLGLGVKGSRALADSLETLPRLREVRAEGNCDEPSLLKGCGPTPESPFAALTGLEVLTHGTRTVKIPGGRVLAVLAPVRKSSDKAAMQIDPRTL